MIVSFRYLLIVILLFPGCASQGVDEITVDQLYEIVHSDQTYFLLDVRPEEQFLKSQLEFTSVHIPSDSLKSFPGRLPEDKAASIYRFCKIGHRSGLAAEYLRSIGYQNVFNVAGGLDAWIEAGYEVINRDDSNLPGN